MYCFNITPNFILINWEKCVKMNRTGFALDQDHRNLYKMVEINGAHTYCKYVRIWLHSLITMSNIKVFARQDGWQADWLAKWSHRFAITHTREKKEKERTNAQTIHIGHTYQISFYLSPLHNQPLCLGYFMPFYKRIIAHTLAVS